MCKLTIAVLLGALAFGQVAADPASGIAQAIRAHQYEQAVKLARAALQHSPNDVGILTMEAIALSAEGNNADALAAYQRALRLAPDYLVALEGAAQMEYKSGSSGAIPLLDHLLKLRPNDPTAHAMRAVMAWEQRDCETAARHFGLAGEAISTQPAALREYAACLARLQRPGEAIPILRQLAALEPGDRQVRYRLAAAQFMARAYADAIDTLGPLIEGNDADPDSLDLASTAWEAMGDTPRAVAALRQAIVLAPTNTRFYVDFASISLTHKSFEAGIAMIDAGLARVPKAADLYLARGVLNVQLAKYDQADADFRKATALNPLQNYSSVALGISLLQEDKQDESVQVVKQRLAKAPDDPTLNYLLAELLIRTGVQPGTPSFREAEAAAQRAVRSKPDFTPAEDVLAELYLRSGETGLAEATSRLALKSDPNDQSALYHLIRALQKSGKASSAAEIPALLTRFNEVRQQLRKQEMEGDRYKLLVEGGSPAPEHTAAPR
jgi:tetratricopeptide (TPR) repeat protein